MSDLKLELGYMLIYRGRCPEREKSELYIVDEGGALFKSWTPKKEARDYTKEEVIDMGRALAGLAHLDIDAVESTDDDNDGDSDDDMGSIHIVKFKTKER